MGNQAYKMQVQWNEKTVRWFQDASQYTDFHKEMAKLLLSMMPERGTLCDLGCGAGLIDFELQKNFNQITCVDWEEDILRLLQKEIVSRDITNMYVINEDINQVRGIWDTVLMMFVGCVADNIKYYLSLCTDRLIIIARGGCINNPVFGTKAREVHSFLPLINRLQNQKVNSSFDEHEIEYGQPFVSLEDVYDYVVLYHKNDQRETVSDYIKKNLRKIPDARFPYYLPYKKKFGSFVIEKSQNLHLFEQ